MTVLTIPALVAGCFSEEPSGIAAAAPASTTVEMDFEEKPLPDIPLPNDIATRHDSTSPTLRRLNASMIAPTGFERRIREKIDELDGWGLYQQITIPFTGPLDIQSVVDAHHTVDFDVTDDVVLLIDIDPDSPEFGDWKALDIGQGNYPIITEQPQKYGPNDTREWLLSMLFEETDEDTNGDGILQPEEDTDADGVLDVPNYLPGMNPGPDAPMRERADALMYFYERETHTLIARPMVPLRDRTTYAVVVTRRLLDADGEPVGSPYPFVNHNSQTEALEPLASVLPDGTSMRDVAFAFTFTTQTVREEWTAIRDGLYGHGPQAHLAEQFPPRIKKFLPMVEPGKGTIRGTSPWLLWGEDFISIWGLVATALLGQDGDSLEFAILTE
ncbi:MAG: hypothetical protein ACYTF3_02175, partial [Planctomycetota bacterium]